MPGSGPNEAFKDRGTETSVSSGKGQHLRNDKFGRACHSSNPMTPRGVGQDMDEFLAVLAHELRNPLMPIRCALEVISRAKGDEETVARAHAIIERQFAQMVRLLDDLFDVARMASGKVSLRKEQTELNGALRLAVEAVQPLIAAKQHVLELALPLMPVHLDGDTVRLTQIVTNLLTNAVKYTPAGGRIRLSACVDSQRGDVQVRVLDTGIGISATELERIFEMFARVDGEDGKRCDGLGVGLALSLDLAMRHGGSITAHSEGPGQGSEFVLTLPVDSLASSLTHENSHAYGLAHRERARLKSPVRPCDAVPTQRACIARQSRAHLLALR